MPAVSRAQALEVLSGPGVHGGRPCRLEIGVRPPRGPGEAEAACAGVSPGGRGGPAVQDPVGPLFRFPGFPGPLSARDLYGLPRTARHATVLGNSAATLAVPEHFLAALLFFAEAHLEIRSDAAELPGLDGSALPYRNALARLLPAVADLPAWREYPCDLAWEHRWPDGHIVARPSDRFRVRYMLEKGPLRQAVAIEDAASAYADILPARTFAFHADWRAALESGLMSGAGPDSGLLLAGSEGEWLALRSSHPEWPAGPFPLLNQSSWRMPDEPVRHKVLDLLGDLALKGLALPRLSIEVRNGGHHAHHLLLARLAEY